MAARSPLYLILCWHMHQPDYRSLASGEFALPWTYLHAIKDYTDMAAHVEACPGIRTVFNFVPVLVDQLEAYAEQFARGEVLDPLLKLLVHEDMDRLDLEQRKQVLDCFFSCNYAKMIEPYAPFKRLHDMFKSLREGDRHYQYLSGQYFADLITWFHLTWTGETVRREHALVARLMAKGSLYTLQERRELFNLIGQIIAGVVPRYRRLAESGRIELSTTPHYHPIGPLMLDFRCALDAQPDAPLPRAPHYPGGRGRAAVHVESALASHRERFGETPAGMWPAEGGVSEDYLRLLEEHGVRWAASGEGVLVGSLKLAGALPERRNYLYRPYRLGVAGQSPLTCFFRDDRLSDFIGFEYSKWYGRDAVNHFVGELEAIRAAAPADETPLVTVILDGENAWEYYPYNGYYFLSELYDVLAKHPDIRTVTFSDYLALGANAGTAVGRLPRMSAGSWVYGNFTTWIGSDAKNRAWDLLCAAKQGFDMVVGSGRLSEQEKEQALRQLAICEGSDWFWWFGDYNPQHSVERFDRLFRENLSNLYRTLQLPAPSELDQPISRGGGEAEGGGTMRRGS